MMEKDIDQELEDLNEIAIGKIKIAYNHSIDLEAIHSVLWESSEKKRKFLLKLILIVGFVLLITIYIPVLFGYINIILISSYISGILVLLIVGLTFYNLFQATHSNNHKVIYEDAISLHRQAEDFLQYKLENLDKEGFIHEIKNLDEFDTVLMEKNLIYGSDFSTNISNQITQKLDELEKSGFKKHMLTEQEMEAITKKIQRFTELRP